MLPGCVWKQKLLVCLAGANTSVNVNYWDYENDILTYS